MKILNRNVREVVNEEGKKIISTEDYTLNYGQEPDYIKIYLDNLLFLKKIPKGYNEILFLFLKNMTWASSQNKHGGQIIYVNSSMKKDIAEELKLSVSRVNQSLTDFVKSGIFKRIDRGTYQVNPNYFGRGNWQDISEIRMSVIFNKYGIDINSDFLEDNEEN